MGGRDLTGALLPKASGALRNLVINASATDRMPWHEIVDQVVAGARDAWSKKGVETW